MSEILTTLLFTVVGPFIDAASMALVQLNQLPQLMQYAAGAGMIALGLVIYLSNGWSRRRRNKRVLIHDPHIPKELLNGRLISSEKHIACSKPRKMHGTPDRVYKNTFRQLLPVDIKTRQSQKIHQTDIVQLSVYAQILKNKGAIAPYGYIRFDSSSQAPRYTKVNLLSTKEVCRRYDRHKNIVAGKTHPYGAQHKALCNGCGHQSHCAVKPN